MCGIYGIVDFQGRPSDRSICERVGKLFSYRGPEDSGTYRFASEGVSVEFIHRRLKLIDLTMDAHQPMSNEKGTLWMVYNGEIYNYIELREELSRLGHRFKSHSDSEVVLHAYEEWGNECLHKFIGMWAFALWDEEKKSIFCARDRLGIKPLYYLYDKGLFIFSSELKAILEYPGIERRLDIQSMYEYLYLGHSLGDRTWIKCIRKLIPGHYLILENAKISVTKYWGAKAEPDYSLQEDEAAQKLKEALVDSVRLMLRADVEVGLHLSGGIDSTSITAIAERLSRCKLMTFSGAFGEKGGFDESGYINEAVDRYGIPNKKMIINTDDFISNIKKIVWHMDEPVAGPGAYPQFCISRLINSFGTKIVLGGQGGDELFGGYPRYYSGILESIRRSATHHKYFKGYYKNGDLFLKFAPMHIRKSLNRHFSLRKNRLKRMLTGDISKQVDFGEIEEKGGFYKGSFEDMQVWDINNYLPALLQVEDRLSMAFSLETRLPFLHHKLVDFALKLPFYYKINSFNFKYILRIAMKDELPLSIVKRTDKKGFPTPMKAWLRDNELRRRISSELNGGLRGIFTDSEMTWEKLNIGIWLKTFKISL